MSSRARQAAKNFVASGTILSLSCLSSCGSDRPKAQVRHTVASRTTWDWNGVVGTGQSLSMGSTSLSASKDLFYVSSTQPYGNMRLHDSTPLHADGGQGPYSISGGGIYSMALLTEPIREPWALGPALDVQYPRNLWGETPQSGMANQSTFAANARGEPGFVSVHSAVGSWGQPMSGIRKYGTGVAYEASLMEARAFKGLADEAGKSFGYQAVVLTHGESDATSTTYEEDLYALWADYDEDLGSITGQTQSILLIASQQGTFPLTGFPLSSLAMWRAGMDYPRSIVCAGPKYQYAYSDGSHLDGAGYRRLGEKYGEILDAIRHGMDWQPLQPVSATLDGSTIAVRFHVPTPPLNWDLTLPLPHTSSASLGIADNREWQNGRGFEVTNVFGKITIDSVSIDGDSVVIQLPAPPSTDSLVVRYAMTQDANVVVGGQSIGRIGQLRDSNDIVGYDAIDVEVNVTNGSPTITGVNPGTFTGRTTRELVTHPELPNDTIIVKRPDDNTAVLSSPWAGPTGTARVNVHNSLHNYAVHFEMAVDPLAP